MSFETYAWLHVGHVLGFVLWVAGLVAVIALLHAHTAADAASRTGLVTGARAMAMIMDLGATLAIALGLVMAFKGPNYPNTAFKSGAWLHIKLTVVVLGIIAPHGMVRAKLGKLHRGTQTTPLAGWVLPAVLAAAAVAIVLGANPTLLRK